MYLLKQKSIHNGNLILVNAKYKFHSATFNDLTFVTEQNPNIQINRSAATLLSELMRKINGWNKIVPVSGWRSLQEQQSIWNNSLKENGLEFTQKFVAIPGHSEHQTGLAIDLALKRENIDFICPEFPYSGICQAFRQHAASYGFVERYPSGKEAVTKIGHEPWHFRYVGIPHALIIQENNLTLEEYIDFIRNYPYGTRSYHYTQNGLNALVSFFEADASVNTFSIEENMPFCISGNNIDGFIITQWRNPNER